jgi:signal transduction histidine kinase/ActR/RegA family two-component response regulator
MACGGIGLTTNRPPAETPAIPADVETERRRWRERTLDGLSWTMTLVFGAAALALTAQTRSAVFGASLGTVILCMGVGTRIRRLGFAARTAILLGGTYTAASLSVALSGLNPNNTVVLCVLVIAATLLLGRAWGFAMVALSAVTLVVLVLLVRAGVLKSYVAPMFDPSDLTFLARVVFVFVGAASICVMSVSYLLARTEELLLQKSQALEDLQHEQAEKAHMQAELDLRDQAFRKARELEILGRLAGSVAHDFNNALLIIQASADLAKHNADYVGTALRDIEGAVKQAAATTRQLRAFAPLPSRAPTTLSLSETVDRAGRLLKRVLPSNIALTVTTDGPTTIHADEGQIQGILTNLALNARDAMPEGGTLTIRVRSATAEEVGAAGLSGRFAAIEVADTGTGMTPGTLARVFEPFFTTKAAAGTGLGLASVRSVVERSSGRIAVASEVGRGTTFRVLWPLHDGVVASEHGAAFARGTGTVLLVDDDEGVRRTMAQSLVMRGYTVLDAPTGADALLVARRYHEAIHVLCSDCVMPGIPVRQLVEGFREVYPRGRVVLCSAYAPEEVDARAPEIDAFLHKPFSPDALAAVLRGLVPEVAAKLA